MTDNLENVKNVVKGTIAVGVGSSVIGSLSKNTPSIMQGSLNTATKTMGMIPMPLAAGAVLGSMQELDVSKNQRKSKKNNLLDFDFDF